MLSGAIQKEATTLFLQTLCRPITVCRYSYITLHYSLSSYHSLLHFTFLFFTLFLEIKRILQTLCHPITVCTTACTRPDLAFVTLPVQCNVWSSLLTLPVQCLVIIIKETKTRDKGPQLPVQCQVITKETKTRHLSTWVQ